MIVFCVEEEEAKEREKKMGRNLEDVKDILIVVSGDCDEDNIEDCYRLGQYTKEKATPGKMLLDSVDHVENIFKRKYRLEKNERL